MPSPSDVITPPATPTRTRFETRKARLLQAHAQLMAQPNRPEALSNGIYERYQHPILTAAHVPPQWKYDFNFETNPHCMERMGINAVLNAGAIFWQGKHYVVCRIEGMDRKSFFGIATSENGIDGWAFQDEPLQVPPLPEGPATNLYDMRLTAHEDGYLYGVFCAERHDANHPEDVSAAEAQCSIIRTQDMEHWERLPDLQTPSPQQRNCVLHPEFVDGQYAFYTRPMSGFLDASTKGGIGWGLCADITEPVITEETVIEERRYHTINELKNGQGPAPIKSAEGWIHLAHGVRNTAAGLRYVLYCFVTELDDPTRLKWRPGGYFIAPEGAERTGDVSNVTFCNGWIAREDGSVYIYYASSDTRMHVATTSVDRLLDYCKNTPPDALTTHGTVAQRIELIRRNG